MAVSAFSDSISLCRPQMRALIAQGREAHLSLAVIMQIQLPENACSRCFVLRVPLTENIDQACRNCPDKKCGRDS